MAHRVFRLSINPERAPAVRRVLDFDGGSSLHDVHNAIQHELELDDDHLYAFYLSGRYFDRSSEYSLSKDAPHDSRSPLFRLGLEPGQKLAYLFDFGDELRHAVTVVAVTEVEAPLEEPVLVESVGKPPSQYGDEPYDLPEHLAEVEPLVNAVLALSERLDELYEADDAKHALKVGDDDAELADDADDDDATGEELSDEGDDEDAELDDDDADDDDATDEDGPPEAIVSLLRELAKAALELAGALEEDEEALHELDEWSQERELLPRLVELPQGLVNVGELDSALAVARAFTFGAAEPFDADIAIILAESGQRDEAIAQLESNLKQFPESWLTAIKSGEAFEVLRDSKAAEASYRRAIELAEDESEGEEAFGQLAELLQDQGRLEEIEELRLTLA